MLTIAPAAMARELAETRESRRGEHRLSWGLHPVLALRFRHQLAGRLSGRISCVADCAPCDGLAYRSNRRS